MTRGQIVSALLDEDGQPPCAEPDGCDVCCLISAQRPGETASEYGDRLLMGATSSPRLPARRGKSVPKARARQRTVQMTPFAAALVTMRRGRGWTQADVAEQTGTHWRTVQGWESGQIEPGAASLARLADLFSVTMDGLWRGLTSRHAGQEGDE